MKGLNFMPHPLANNMYNSNGNMDTRNFHQHSTYSDRIDQQFSKFDISHQCMEQDFEICAIQSVIRTANLIILSLYRAPSGDVSEFLIRLAVTLKYP